MENGLDKEQVKIFLYAYPKLESLIKDYEGHIREKAIRSYGVRDDAERAAEYIADQIVSMRALERLKRDLDELLEKLSETEKLLAAARYFGLKRKVVKEKLLEGREEIKSERSYFRRQDKLLKKIAVLMQTAGLDKKVFQENYAGIEELQRICRFVRKGKDKRLYEREKSWFFNP